MGGSTKDFLNSMLNPIQQVKDVVTGLKGSKYDTAQEEKPTPQMVEDNTKAVEEERLRNAKKQGRASTILAGDWRASSTGAGKRLLGE